MEKSIFRKESLDKVTSPEQLNDYIRVSSPSVWIVLSAIIILLVSVIFWSVFANLETTLKTGGIAENGKVICYVSDISELEVGLKVHLGDGTDAVISSISEMPYSKDEVSQKYDNGYTVHSLSLSDWNYEIVIDAPKTADGIEEVELVLDSVNPISFIWN